MEQLCEGDIFWDSDLTWHNNSWPELTDCFENTVLTWVPCFFLLLTCPLYILYLVNSSSRSSNSFTKLFILKEFCSILMIGLLMAELANSAQQAFYFNDEILSYTIWIAVMILHIFVVNLERTRDLHRFPVLFVFWLLGSIALLIQFCSSIATEVYESEPFHFALLTCRYILSSSLLLLHCFSSHTGWKYKNNKDPYVTASLPSLLLILWMEPLVIKGFKKPLQHEDLYSLPQGNSTYDVMTKFQKRWDKEKKNCKRQRRKSKKVLVEDIDLCDIPLQSPLKEDDEKQKTDTISESSPFLQPSFTKALLKNFWFEMVKAQAGQLARVIDTVFNPFILGFFIDYTSNQELTWHGFVYTGGILLLKIIAISLGYPSGYLISLFSIRIQNAVMGSVFRKSLTVSARKESTTGEIINLMSVDATNLKIWGDYSFWLWMSFLYFFIGIALTVTIVGLALLPGLGCILVIFLMNIFILCKIRIYRTDIMTIKDERVKIMNEVLNGIKVIKLYGWENTFLKRITEIREKELKILLKISILEAMFNFAWKGALFWMNFFILVTYVMIDDAHYLEAKTAFVTLSYIGMVRLAVNTLPIIGQDLIKACTSLERITKFMNAEDISLSNLKRDTSDSLAVRINGDFAWERSGYTILKSIDLEVQPGKLIAVVGTVGAGKSSLLSAMLGEMHKVKGYVNLNSSVAYVPQQAWIQNATVKRNILFGSPFRQDLYDKVIKSCCLEADLDIMAAGDNTEIGEKGINLSGGQKQRISLARALYSQADIYLLDDPLSAVDSHVGRHIFDKAIGPNGCLRGKTRILVTHGVQWLPDVDHILVMENGQISETGRLDELLAQNGDFARFLTQYFIQHGGLDPVKVEDIDNDCDFKKDLFQRLISVASDSDGSSVKETLGVQRLLSVTNYPTDIPGAFLGHDMRLSTTSLHKMSHEAENLTEEMKMGKTGASRLTTDEEAAGGRISNKMYWHLWKGIGLGYTAIIFFFIFVYHVSFNYANYWIANWNDDYLLSNFTELPANSTARLDRNIHFIVIFTVIGLIQTVSVLVYSFLLFIRHVAACRKLHAKLLNSVIRAPMSYFDTTPVGRILNRFSQDIEVIDNDLFYELTDVIDFFLKGVGILIVISYTLPWFLAVLIPAILLVLGVERLFVVNSCQSRRLASNKRSPIFAHFSETLSGASVIRAYQAQEQFINDSNSKIDDCQKADGAAKALNRWMYSRLDMVAFIVVGSVCIFATVMRNELTPGTIGLSVSYAIEISIMLCLVFEFIGMLETHLVSVERVREYSVIKSEAPWTIPDDSQSLHINDCGNWPSVGNIEFKSYSTRYREGLDLVLKEINCDINGGEKVGIVGRTGAGKSSMVLSLFRLIEAVSGRIVIDGVNIANIGLHTLRHNITILPQDPVLFAGTLRMNLDPNEEKMDSEIWTALEHSHLKNFVMGLDNKLSHNVRESGENFSLGQRQLLCLARTLLRKTKILILDEATASVDMDTDDLIQNTIRTEFSECTILTIAHRLNTVLDYDRIMVLDSGQIKEFDSPSSLLSNPDSAFYSMAKEAGLVGKET